MPKRCPTRSRGHVGIDLTGDCETNPDTPPIAGVVIHLLNAQGHVIGTTTTDANGNYKFDNLAPGTYGVFEEQPAGYSNGDNHVGSVGGMLNGTDTVTQIVLTSGIARRALRLLRAAAGQHQRPRAASTPPATARPIPTPRPLPA